MEYWSLEKKKWQKEKEQINKSYPLRFAEKNEDCYALAVFIFSSHLGEIIRWFRVNFTNLG